MVTGVLGTLSALYLLLIICLGKRIELAVAIMKTASMFVADNISSLLIPPLSFLALIGYFLWWITVALYLYSVGTVSHVPGSLPFGTFDHSPLMLKMLYVHGFALLWKLSFILAASDFILVSATTLWYFSRGAG